MTSCPVQGCKGIPFGGTVFCETHAVAWAHSSEYRRVGITTWTMVALSDLHAARIRTAIHDFVVRIEREGVAADTKTVTGATKTG